MNVNALKYVMGVLRRIGLDEDESRAYLALLEFGALTVSVLALKIRAKRTNVYNIVDRLVEKGLALESNKGKVKYFSAVEPEKLIFLLERLREQVDTNIVDVKELLPQLKSLRNPLSIKPKVNFFQGESGLKGLLELALNSGDFVAYFDLDSSYGAYKDVVDQFVKNINSRKPVIRELLVRGKNVESYLDAIKNENYQFRFFEDGVKFYTDQIVFGNFVAMLSYRENFTGVLIESADIADAQRTVFELLWKGGVNGEL